MKSVLISIQPKWCEKICHEIGKEEAGKPIYEKRIEVRKTAPKEVPFKVYIYATRPKKYYKCGAVSTSDELLWLANCKIEMGDGFKFWADGDEYQCLNGRIIGEFICDRVYNFLMSYTDGGSAELRKQYYLIGENSKIIDEFWKGCCISPEELSQYIKPDELIYGWHISDLKIYDKPKELSEFKEPNGRKISRPPQSWCYVEEI